MNSSYKYFLAVSVIVFGFVIYHFYFKVVDTDVNIESLVKPDITYEEVTFDENNVVVASSYISITEAGTYVFSGNYDDVNVLVEASGEVVIVLDSASMTSSNDQLFYIESADSVLIYTTDSVSSLTIDYESSELDGAVIYCKEDLVISGEGTINITSNYYDGINARDDLYVENVTLNVDTAGDGIVGRDYLVFTEADINITSGLDGIKTSNEESGDILIESGNFVIDAIHDGISAEGTLQIDGGTFDISTNGGYDFIIKTITVGEGSGNTVQKEYIDYSAKSLKSYDILINGGTFNISSFEDAVHADNNLNIVSGTFVISCGDTAVHADNNLLIDGIDLLVNDGYEGIEGYNITINDGDIDISVLDDAVNSDSTLTINGGTIYLYSQGDGLDSNGDLIINDGYIVIENDAIYTGGDSAIDVSGSISVNGGTIVDENGNSISYSSSSSQSSQGSQNFQRR